MISSFEGLGYGLLNDVLGALRSEDGYAQPNRYEIEIGLPKIIQSGGGSSGNPNSLTAAFASLLPSAISGLAQGGKGGGLRSIQLRAAQVTLPGRNIETVDDVNIYGPVRRVASGINYAEDLNLQFQASSGLEERKFFENWQNAMFNEDTWNMSYYNDYVGSISVFILDKNDKRRYGLKGWEAYPKTIGGNDLTYASQNEIILLPVTFQFRYWTVADKERMPGGSIIGNLAETAIDHVSRNISRNVPRILNL